MEIAHKEDPQDAQICFWLGREYMWAKQHERGIELLQRYLALPSSTWTEERSEAMRYLAHMQPDEEDALAGQGANRSAASARNLA